MICNLNLCSFYCQRVAEITCYGSRPITDVIHITRMMVGLSSLILSCLTMNMLCMAFHYFQSLVEVFVTIKCTHTDLPLKSTVSNSTLLDE